MTKQLEILVVDDDKAHRTMLGKLLAGWGYQISMATDGSEAIDAVDRVEFDVILMDIRMVNVSGIEALERIKAINPAIPIVLMTAYASVETAVSALKKGAYDYLIKPLDFDELQIVLARATEHRLLKKENESLRERLGEQFDRQSIIGRSQAMIRLLETVEQVAPTQATVLIDGESGTGKEIIANALHFNSPRSKASFVKINCAALAETLLESELFGHEKGAFTGADRRRDGKFMQADGGSIFLDEVSEMSTAMQVKLLRVLQEREVTRVGGAESIPVDVRVIAASNKDLKKEIREGRFREDLFYRLNVIALQVPPLRQRQGDIPLLAQHFLRLFAERNGRSIKGFSREALIRLEHYDWPGNVRELMNTVERAVVLSRADVVDTGDLSFPMAQAPLADPSATTDFSLTIPEAGSGSLEEVEKRSILDTLRLSGGNKSEAARRLGITRKTLRKKLEKYESI